MVSEAPTVDLKLSSRQVSSALVPCAAAVWLFRAFVYCQLDCGSWRWTIALSEHLPPVCALSHDCGLNHEIMLQLVRGSTVIALVDCGGLGRQGFSVTGQESEQCAIMRAEDGRWRARPCTEDYPSACRTEEAEWVLGVGKSRGRCPGGASFALPAHAKDNAALQRELQRSGQQACWLPMQGALPLQSALPLRQIAGLGPGAYVQESSNFSPVSLARQGGFCHVTPASLVRYTSCSLLQSGRVHVWCIACCLSSCDRAVDLCMRKNSSQQRDKCLHCLMHLQTPGFACCQSLKGYSLSDVFRVSSL